MDASVVDPWDQGGGVETARRGFADDDVDVGVGCFDGAAITE